MSVQRADKARTSSGAEGCRPQYLQPMQDQIHFAFYLPSGRSETSKTSFNKDQPQLKKIIQHKDVQPLFCTVKITFTFLQVPTLMQGLSSDIELKRRPFLAACR